MHDKVLLLRHANLFARHECDVEGTSLIKYRLELEDLNLFLLRGLLRQHPEFGYCRSRSC
jgi:hypothetical protein